MQQQGVFCNCREVRLYYHATVNYLRWGSHHLLSSSFEFMENMSFHRSDWGAYTEMHGQASHHQCLTINSQNLHSRGGNNIYHENDLHWRARKTEAFPTANPPSQRPSAASKSEEQAAAEQPRSHPNSQPLHLQTPYIHRHFAHRAVPYRG